MNFSSLPRLDVIVDPPAAGTWNMAVDEAMFAAVESSGVPILRFYAWSEPTLSLGYFQSLADREQHAASLACPVVRRSTGGGAIVHDRELTYSIGLPVPLSAKELAIQVYDWLHQSLVTALACDGIASSLMTKAPRVTAEPFLCFQRRAERDVVVLEQKIGGSAQRRRRDCLLQHGSVLHARSNAAPELPGLSDLGYRQDIENLRAVWLETLRKLNVFPTQFVERTWSNAELKLARRLEAEQFLSPEWTRKR